MIISRKQKYDSQPKQNADIERVKSMKILGVIHVLNNKLRAADHVRAILNNCSRSLYALRILKAHGLQSQAIHKVTEATLMSRLLYASPAWWGLTTTKDKLNLERQQRKLIKMNYLPDKETTFEKKVHTAEEKLFKKIISIMKNMSL